uniref:Uncharacterized protein n=1 Tax=Triticum urartu TaxID=4572 RepID=A0A8R7V5T4_TRIUA
YPPSLSLSLHSRAPSSHQLTLTLTRNRIRRALVAGSLTHRPGGRCVSSAPLRSRQPPPFHCLGFGCGVGRNRALLSDALFEPGGLVGRGQA